MTKKRAGIYAYKHPYVQKPKNTVIHDNIAPQIPHGKELYCNASRVIQRYTLERLPKHILPCCDLTLFVLKTWTSLICASRMVSSGWFCVTANDESCSLRWEKDGDISRADRRRKERERSQHRKSWWRSIKNRVAFWQDDEVHTNARTLLNHYFGA